MRILARTRTGTRRRIDRLRTGLATSLALAMVIAASEVVSLAGVPPDAGMEIGIATCDITPQPPIWLAGYAARKKPADRVDSPLVAQAVALKNPTGERFVFVAVDNCEVNHQFSIPTVRAMEEKHGLRAGEVMIVSSHTHSAPVLEGVLDGMYALGPEDRQKVVAYGEFLRGKIIDVVGAALQELRPALLEHGIGRATFAMNRRIYREEGVNFGENLDGPVDWDVPVLRIKGTNGVLRAVLFGYACHGTSIQGDDFYIACGDYMAFARQHLESLLPGARAVYITGMGADSNPSPRGTLLDAKRHGLELGGAVMAVLNRPMRPVRGPFSLAYEEVDLPLEDPPTREQLEQDAKNQDVYKRNRAEKYLGLLTAGQPLPKVRLPLACLRLSGDLTFLAMGGEVVVDYSIRFKRTFAQDKPWMIGYAYEVPCYIPTVRILREGGYEADSSLIYYGLYGPFKGRTEELLASRMSALVARTRGE